ncbi:fatty acid desaturase [Sphingomonas abietis]|uniref:Fatty acid desaturase n=1 Tax=Sphingomonas abietis TaxID=3012344 RepID=A0ABY7NS09_9SPHN|nr:fatty acid desaturase [Sphingomonas abietis]WBO23750.1 fatty acid desaturase [Sphingomonas abietis]
MALTMVVYGGWMAVTWFHAALPTGLLVVAGGWFVAWHSSLQHETIHGHPTPWPRLNSLIGAVPLSLWLPYTCYRRDHLAHHATSETTDPREDPESHYLLPATGWRETLRRAVATVQAPLLGRLLLGPAIMIAGFLGAQAIRAWRTPSEAVRDWAPHMIGVALILTWLSICHLGVGLYLLAFVYPGSALTLLRSFAEHRAATAPGHRVAIVERAGPLSLLFLHNNLHAVHHAAPALPWYRIPAFYRRNRAAIVHANGGLVYRGYGDVARRYGLRAHDALIHPRFLAETAPR